MEEPSLNPRRFQISLAAILLLTASLGIGAALIRAGFSATALCAAFPFAVGVIIGQTAKHPIWSPFVSAAVVPPMWGLIGSFLDPMPGLSIIRTMLAGALFVPVVLMYGFIPTLAGWFVSSRLCPRAASWKTRFQTDPLHSENGVPHERLR